MGPRPEDMTRHDLATLTWQWILEEYTRLIEEVPEGAMGERTMAKLARYEIRGRCQAHSRALQFLLSISHEEVLERTRLAYERGLPPDNDEEL